jgi:hypothetical protein
MAKDREVAPFAFNGVAGPRKRGNKLRRNALAPVLALVLACGGSSTPQDGGHSSSSPIDAPTAASLTASLGQASALAGLPAESALAAKAAILAIGAGAEVSDVTISASALAGIPARAALTNGTAKSFGFQIQVVHAPGSTAPQTFSGVLLFQGGSDWVLVAGPTSGGPFPQAVGLIGTGGQVWEATAGQESAQVQTQGAACTGTLPAIVTSCNVATFSNAGFDISSSAPSSSGATGSKTVSLPTGSLASGVVLVVDCSLGTGCSVPIGNSTCTFNHTQSLSIELSGDVNLSFVEGPAFLVFNWNPTSNESSFVFSQGSVPNPTNPDAGVSALTGQFFFPGQPVAGPAHLGSTTVPSQVAIILTDPLHTTYFSKATPDGGQMDFTITGIDGRGTLPDAGPANFWCGHGQIHAVVPDLTVPTRVITVGAGF